MTNNIKFESLKTQDNIIIENKFKKMLNNKVILSDIKKRFN